MNNARNEAIKAAAQRMLIDLREQEASGLCRRMRIEQITDLEMALGVKHLPIPRTAKSTA